MKIAVSFLKSIYDNQTTIDKIDSSIADYIHVDVVDGKFVENKNFTPYELKKILSHVSKKLDVHLMVVNPLKYLNTVALLNTEYLTFHYETVKDIEEMIEQIKLTGLKAGISINPETTVEKIISYLPLIDQVLVMSVKPGAGGQSFIESSLEKIKKLKELKEANNYQYIISVDGSINTETAPLVKEAGVDMLVSGSFICNEEDFDEQIKKII